LPGNRAARSDRFARAGAVLPAPSRAWQVRRDAEFGTVVREASRVSACA